MRKSHTTAEAKIFTNPVALTLFASLAAFMVYSCMYAYRKAFAAAGFSEFEAQFGLSFKTLLVLSQLAGYTLSKFIGIKVVSELKPTQRGKAILLAIGLAELALVGFALAPVRMKWMFMLLNGLPLGLIWGIVFSFVEGRRSTELIGAVLCTSFIFASGMAKSVGKWLMLSGVPDLWMPAATGAVFALPLVISVGLLVRVPPPNAQDVAERAERVPMFAQQRKEFFWHFAWGLVPLIVLYTLLTAFRDMRDNFMAEVLKEIGQGNNAMVFTSTEVPVAIGVLASLSLIMYIRSNKVALTVNILAIVLGCMLVAGASALFSLGMIEPLYWVTCTGLGAYLAYIPFNCILFERLMALQRYPGNAGFLIYVADSFGYLMSMIVLLFRDALAVNLQWTPFFIKGSYAIGVVGLVLAPFALINLVKVKSDVQA